MLIKESHVDVPTSANGKEGTMRMSSSTLTICDMRGLPTYTTLVTRHLCLSSHYSWIS